MHPDTIAALARIHRSDLDREAERRSLADAVREARSGDAAGLPAAPVAIAAAPIGRVASIVATVLRIGRPTGLRA